MRRTENRCVVVAAQFRAVEEDAGKGPAGASFSGGVLVLSLVVLCGCGTNRFQQELQTEEAAVKLVNETLEGDYGLLDTAELKALVDSDEAFLLVDAMPAADSYDRGHIEGAVNFEFDKEVIDRWSDEDLQGPRAEAFLQLLGEDKDRKLVMYCGFVKCGEATMRRCWPVSWATRTCSATRAGSSPGKGPVIR